MITSIKSSEPCYAVPCAVCGKAVPITQSEARYVTFRLCDECIKAIKFAKRFMNANTNMLPNLDEDDGK